MELANVAVRHKCMQYSPSERIATNVWNSMWVCVSLSLCHNRPRTKTVSNVFLLIWTTKKSDSCLHISNIRFHVDITRTQPIAECACRAQRMAESTKIKQTTVYCECKWSLMKSDLTMTPNVTSWNLVAFFSIQEVKNTKMLRKAEKLNATNYYTLRLNSSI